MRKSRLIIIFSIVLAIITTVITILMNYMWPNLIDYFGILTNIHCGIIVGLVTSICQYFVQKRALDTLWIQHFLLEISFEMILNRFKKNMHAKGKTKFVV